MEITTLIRLSKNPNYKLSPEQIQQLEDYRNEQFKGKNKNKVVRHSTKFGKHNPSIPQEDEVRKDSNGGKQTSRG